MNDAFRANFGVFTEKFDGLWDQYYNQSIRKNYTNLNNYIT